MFSAIREQIQTVFRDDPAAKSVFEVLTCYPGVHAILLHRLSHQLYRWRLFIIARLLSHFGRWLTGVEIHPGATIGRRFFIDHGMGVVIGETAVIGDDCHLYQGVTLGGTSTRRERRHPTLEDGVEVGAGATIIGAVTIGSHARIGAGAVVVSSVPARATVVGVPGHIVAYTNRGNDTIERLPDPEWERIDELEQRLARLEGLRAGAPGSDRGAGEGDAEDALDGAPEARRDRIDA